MFSRFFLTTLALFSFTSSSVQAQNCANNTTGLPPLNDLGTGFYEGLQGGLYPEGQNFRPSVHNAAGLLIASQIQPLDENGDINLSTGKIVMMSVGMSNTRQEFDSLQAAFAAYSDGNPQLVLVNGAQDGQDIDNLIRNSTQYWLNAADSLAAAGVTARQVQVIWFKEAQSHPLIPPLFPDYPDTLKEKFKTAMNLMVRNVPNVRICYLSCRIYGNYGTTPLNLEPYAYQSGWAVKRLIEDQINGDRRLSYSGPNPRAPWLAWGPYLWADGINARKDGLSWICPTDYLPDGNHPSAIGRQKVANMLMDFFTTDSTSIPWFKGAGGGQTIPAAPTDLRASVASSRRINLSWTDNSANESQFAIERRSAGGEFVQIAAVGTDVTSYSNGGLQPNTTYTYRVRASNDAGFSPYSNTAKGKTSPTFPEVSGGVEKSDSIPHAATDGIVTSAFPNPFNPSTTIRFALPSASHVDLRICNTLGQVVATLVDGVQEAGTHEARFDASRLTSGMYFYQLITPGGSAVRTLILLK